MTEEIIDPSTRGLFNLKELWKYRELFYFFTWRDIKIKYKQTLLGFLWAILQPVLMMTIFALVFGRTLSIPSQSLPYPVYVFSGLLIWTLFSNGLTGASSSMVNNSLIVKKIYFPRLVIPVSSVLVSLFDCLIGFFPFIGVLIYYGQPVSASALLYWPLAIVVGVIATLGPGCLLAALNVKYRDVRYVVPFFIQALLFLTPVIYPVSMIKYPALQYLLAATPTYAAIELFRLPISGSPLNGQFIMISLSSGIFFLIVGLLYFRRSEDFFADLV
jgi:lipopolysaccharide transport system permease protein